MNPPSLHSLLEELQNNVSQALAAATTRQQAKIPNSLREKITCANETVTEVLNTLQNHELQVS